MTWFKENANGVEMACKYLQDGENVILIKVKLDDLKNQLGLEDKYHRSVFPEHCICQGNGTAVCPVHTPVDVRTTQI